MVTKCIGGIILLSATLLNAAGLSLPLGPLPSAYGFASGSYNLESTYITNDSILCLLNRISGAVGLSPTSWMSLSGSVGATQVEVESDTLRSQSDTAITYKFHGGWGLSGGANLQLRTPLLFDLMGLVATASATYFNSKNKNNAAYGGIEGCAGSGLMFHIRKAGYIAVGANLLLLQGINKSYLGEEGKYSNLDNIRGWVSINLFPPRTLLFNQQLFISLDLSATPKADYINSIPRNTGIAITIGTLTKRLYGTQNDIEWEP